MYFFSRGEFKPYFITFTSGCVSHRLSVKPSHLYYGDETFKSDSMGLELGQRLNFILKNILRYFLGKTAFKKGVCDMGTIGKPECVWSAKQD